MGKRLVTTDATRSRMSRQRSHGTGPELDLRRALFALGLRYRVHVRPLATVRLQADLVFGGPKVAVFVDGCFWHRCPEHGTEPCNNSEFWRAKLDRNVARDRDFDRLLKKSGWLVIRIWEHEDSADAAERIARLVRRRRR